MKFPLSPSTHKAFIREDSDKHKEEYREKNFVQTARIHRKFDTDESKPINSDQQRYSLSRNQSIQQLHSSKSQHEELTKESSKKSLIVGQPLAFNQTENPDKISKINNVSNRGDMLQQDRKNLLRQRTEEFADHKERMKLTNEDREKFYNFLKNPQVNAQILFHRYWVNEKQIWISEDKDQLRFLKEKEKVRKYYEAFKPI